MVIVWPTASWSSLTGIPTVPMLTKRWCDEDRRRSASYHVISGDRCALGWRTGDKQGGPVEARQARGRTGDAPRPLLTPQGRVLTARAHGRTNMPKQPTQKVSTTTRRTKTKKDPAAPKRPLSAYMFFSQDWRERVKAENPDAGFGT